MGWGLKRSNNLPKSTSLIRERWDKALNLLSLSSVLQHVTVQFMQYLTNFKKEYIADSLSSTKLEIRAK
jgi:hypothetical protein